jgi:hypothetical protein
MQHLVYQPHGSNYCGQACVATVLGVTLEDAIDLVGKRGYTNTRHMREALAKKGFVLGPRQTLKDKKPLRMYMARVRWKGRKHSHWVVLTEEGRVFDPSFGYDPDWTGGYISSIYEVSDGSNPEIYGLAVKATRLMDNINREELSGEKYQNLKEAAKLVHRIRQLAGG